MFEFELEALKITWNSISQRKLRSTLTVIGIAIGIAAIISLVSISEGLKQTITKQLQQFGANKIVVMPFASTSTTSSFASSYFTEDDVKKVEKVSGVELVVPFLLKTVSVEYKGEKELIMVAGIEPEKTKNLFENIQGYELESGSFLRKNDKTSVILGNAVAHDMFSEEVEVGDKIKIGDKTFRVKGILKRVGNRLDDNTIVVPMNPLREITGEQKEITMMMVEAKNAEEVEKVAERIRKKLEDYWKKGTFTVLTTRQLAERIKIITSAMTIFLGGIAAISLIVAGIGIANTMLMSVMEKTREIGIMKAIGATNKDVLKIFLIESILLSIIGGIVGCGIGILGSKSLNGVSMVQGGVPLRTSVPPSLIAFGLGFSAIVGIIFGLWPAYKAATLNPVEALRYE
ncbi:MAG: ABC transporter permease [Candidatus Aenigmarchaeota archaeon]|nr:ABC transporter permease [Candidatus Aenigmarchaeota archaeon]